MIDYSFLLIGIAIALLLTILIEWAIVSLFIRKNYSKLLGYSVLINGLTLPLVTFLTKQFFPFGWFFGEIGAVLIESVFWYYLLKDQSYKKILLMVFIANLITALIGVLFFPVLY